MHCLIYFGFIECLYMHVLAGIYLEGIPALQTELHSSYARLSFVTKIHAVSFVFNFLREIHQKLV